LRAPSRQGAPLTRGAARAPLVSVVVPTLDEARGLPGLLDHLDGLRGRFEVVVADGGSRDGTRELARAHALEPAVVESARGRAGQLNAGARAARGELLVFLHADSRLPPGAHATLTAASRSGIEGGNFDLRFAGSDLFSRLLGAVYAAQRRCGVYYGDSTLWVTRAAWDELGGFRALPIMDDYDFARRLERRGRTARLPGPALTSARRWRRMGIPRTVVSWVVIRWLYLAGIPPERLAALYRPVREERAGSADRRRKGGARSGRKLGSGGEREGSHC
jgi:rSAM/selenodomain-associated transferase 2